MAAIIVSLCTFIGVTKSIGAYGETQLQFFTMLSNLLSATGALFMLPYAVEGIRKKRFTLPRWVCLFQYAGAVSVFITMFCACTIITITLGADFAFGGVQLWLHLIIPILALVLFLAVESDHYLTKKDTVLALIPFWIYVAFYFVMVVLVGKENGGWNDLYQVTRMPIWLSFLMLFSTGYAAAIFLRIIHNRIIDKSIAKLTANWNEEISSVELKIEAFGLGRYMASHLDKNEIIIPMDLFSLMADKCDVSIEELCRAYLKGALSDPKEN